MLLEDDGVDWGDEGETGGGGKMRATGHKFKVLLQVISRQGDGRGEYAWVMGK